MKRAGTEDKKRQRREDILEVARRLVAERGCDSWRLDEVAKSLSLVKGTLYLYFPTRQDLLAALLREEMEAWWKEVLQQPAPVQPDHHPQEDGNLPKNMEPHPVESLTRPLAERPLLVKLLTSLHMGIEPGISPEGLVELKLWFADFFLRAAGSAGKILPNLGSDAGQFMLEFYSLAVGAAQLAYPPPAVADLVATREDLAMFRIPFGPFLNQAAARLYEGMKTPG